MIPQRCILAVLLAFFPLTACAQDSGGGKKESAKKQDKDQSKKKPTIIQVFNGKDLKGLSVLNKSYFEDHGKVEVKEGQLVLSAGEPGTGVAADPKILKNLPRINYEVQITAQRVKGSDFFCGLTFPVNKTYCTLILGGWGGGAIGLSNVDSMSAIENETTEFHEFKNGKWYDIQLVVTEKHITATLKEQGAKESRKLFKIETPDHKFDIWWEQEPARPFGVTTWNTTAAFKKLTIRPLTTDDKKSNKSAPKKQSSPKKSKQ